jgi:hypothetical protein
MSDAASSATSGPPLVSGAAFAARLTEHGFDFFAGVPCSLIEDVLAGPHVVLAKVTAEEAAVPRIAHTPHAIRDRVRAALGAP